MHDIKFIRKNTNFFSKKISDRNVIFDIKNLLELDEKNRKLIQNKEKLEQEKKIISQKKDESLYKKSKEISSEIEKLNKDQTKIKNELEVIVSSLPNVALDDVPIGKDESQTE